MTLYQRINLREDDEEEKREKQIIFENDNSEVIDQSTMAEIFDYFGTKEILIYYDQETERITIISYTN